MNQAQKHLSRDPIMKKLIGEHQLKEYWGSKGNYFLDLVDIVTGQQLSVKAAATIFSRLEQLFFPDSPTPETVLSTSLDQLRAIGLSRSKSSYIHNIAQAVKEGTLDLDAIEGLDDQIIIDQLINIKGLGPWSAEMFLMFSLKRPDIFSVGDLGLRKAIERHYSVSADDHQQILELAESWRPHRTTAARYLWASLDNV